jgi:hypothetical protein
MYPGVDWARRAEGADVGVGKVQHAHEQSQPGCKVAVASRVEGALDRGGRAGRGRPHCDEENAETEVDLGQGWKRREGQRVGRASALKSASGAGE